MHTTGIPAHYRQLTRAQILSRWPGQERPRCYVELVRLLEPQPAIVFAGEAALYLQWSDYATGGRRACKLKAGEPRTLALISVSDRNWAEYSPGNDLSDGGSLVCEDYQMRLYAEDGLGRTQAEEAAFWQEQADALVSAVAGTFADLGARAVTLGDVTIAAPPTLAGYVAQARQIAAAAVEAHVAADNDTAKWAPHRDRACREIDAIWAQLQAAVELAPTIEARLDVYEALVDVQNLRLGIPVLAGDRY